MTASIATGKTASFVSAASDFCQRHTDRQVSWRHVSEGGFNSRLFEVARLDLDTANSFVDRHHYAGKGGGFVKNAHFGLYQSERLVGVAQLSNAGFKKVLLNAFPDLEPYDESAELARFVLIDEVPANAESWFLARVWELAASDGRRGIVSHSDPVARYDAQGQLTMPGHVGMIYQATNARYTGRLDGRTIWKLPNGRVFNEQDIGKIRQLKEGHEYCEGILRSFGATARRKRESGVDYWHRAKREAGCTSERHPGNHRYQFTLAPWRAGLSKRQLSILRRDPKPVALGFQPTAYPKPPCTCQAAA